jgi:hypothetical protein
MSDEDKAASDDLLATLFSRHLVRCSEFKTPSGRRFRYDPSRYQIGPSTTQAEPEALAKTIFREQYKESEWDRKHPHVDVRKEITAELVKSILKVADVLRRSEGRKPKGP